jgi:succinyl-diaminopimelate desuccinylase
MQALEYVVKNDLKIKYGILIVSDEESGGVCAQSWAEKTGLRAKVVLDGDGGSNLDNIVQKSKGCCFIKLISKGKSTHGSRPWDGVDAIENLINTVVNLRKIFPYISEETKLENKWIETMHVGVFKGGTVVNAIAPLAEAEIDIRFTENYTPEEILNIIKDCIVGNVEIVSHSGGKAIFNRSDDKYLQLYKSIAEGVTGKTMRFGFETGGTDARFFNDGKTTIITNQPTGGEIHADGEWIDIESLETFLNIKKEFLGKIGEYF